ncbi:MAG: ABC transporter ATP-binding protein [Phycisphaerales bacterium]|mgnify:CR=1 FL=1|nr:ABC transporter ATP-binding protein [Phycisphaerales bacterium]
MLDARAIEKSFATRSGTLTVLAGVTLQLENGASAAIMGPSGSGKSTLLNILGTLEPPTSGALQIDGRDPFTLDNRELGVFRNRTVGLVFQDHHLLPQCSALENVLLPTLAGEADPAAPRRGRELLERVGLADRSDHRPAELSGGERQRVAIARALVNRPRLLLADEPTGNLDRRTADRVADLLVELHAGSDLILIVVTHSETLAARFAQRWELADGRLERQ